jgi:hypothetical protein
VRRGCLALCFLLTTAPAHAAAQALPAAEALVRAQYGPDMDDTPEGALRLYEPRLAHELTESSTAAGGDFGFDLRYGDSDWQVRDMTFTTMETPDGATVAVRFLNFGKPVEIDWRLIPDAASAQGWRVSDISAPEQNGQMPWDLRRLVLIDP